MTDSRMLLFNKQGIDVLNDIISNTHFKSFPEIWYLQSQVHQQKKHSLSCRNHIMGESESCLACWLELKDLSLSLSFSFPNKTVKHTKQKHLVGLWYLSRSLGKFKAFINILLPD